MEKIKNDDLINQVKKIHKYSKFEAKEYDRKTLADTKIEENNSTRQWTYQ